MVAVSDGRISATGDGRGRFRDGHLLPCNELTGTAPVLAVGRVSACASLLEPSNPLGSATRNEATTMFSWAVTFLIIAIVAAVFGFTGIAGTATNIAWILFVVGLILFVVFAIMGRRPRI